MKQYISVLRGINVGGHRKILMADLKNLFIELGFFDVETYIQSGNVIFSAKNGLSCSNLSVKIQQKIKEIYGFDVPSIIISAVDFIKVMQNNPYVKDHKKEGLFLSFLSNIPAEEELLEINKYSFLPDKFEIFESFVFGYCEGKYHQTKISNQFFEKKLNVSATTRNWKTVLKISEMVLPSSHKKS